MEEAQSVKKRLAEIAERLAWLDKEIGRTTFGGFKVYSLNQESDMHAEQERLLEERDELQNTLP